ncbi:uncharacterized protein A1O5_09596 [Cladophialophora psammophila CBS 110553]|uniref:SMP-30/Gluconolactonase/LRE-like region domain-containing protein n=1 Tax=Cladophialophora psammophila CBS 110553 TaxID=1182543 RepID=W9WI41_9EURO|nr:uncharacterized protein A1O5_09596 [Cladophialophora psammophila CBS 110553]EXJ67583.1 hypothetical protein A1O5_09596 [Cladophialophora psammophila CBS 110553]
MHIEQEPFLKDAREATRRSTCTYSSPESGCRVDNLGREPRLVPDAAGHYFGVHFNSPNDVVWAHRPNADALFFTDNSFGNVLHNVTGPTQLPSTVWRFDPQAQSLQAVISRAEIPDPNDLATNPNSTKLYVTDTPISELQGRGLGNATGSPAVYAYDLDETLTPVNKRLFALAREGVPDGIKVDRYGRVWTAEGEGVVVRNPQGKVLGLFNVHKRVEDDPLHIANFGFADDRLIVLAATQIWSIRLGQTLGWTVSA